MLAIAMFTAAMAFVAWFILISWQAANWGWKPEATLGTPAAFTEATKPVIVPDAGPSTGSAIPIPETGDGVVTINAVIHGTATDGTTGSTTLLIAGFRKNGLYTLSQISKSVFGTDFSASLNIQQGATSEPTLELINNTSGTASWTLFYTFTFSATN